MRGYLSPDGWRERLAALQAAAKQYVDALMQAAAPHGFRPKSFDQWETLGSEGFQTLWRTAVDGPADWVRIVTWNEYSEATGISPSRGIQYACHGLTAFYTTAVRWVAAREPRSWLSGSA